MNQTVAKPPRCQYRTRSGRLCRRDAAPESKFCSHHATAVDDHVDPGLEAALTAGLKKFDSPAAINDFLGRLMRLLAQDRISPRRAAVLAYISNQMLRSVNAIGKEEERNRANQPIEYVIGIPRPKYDEPEPGSEEAKQLKKEDCHFTNSGAWLWAQES